MRTTIDIPDETYRELRILAVERATSVRKLVLEGVALLQQRKRPSTQRFEVPVIHSSRPGTLDLTNEQIDDLIAFS